MPSISGLNYFHSGVLTVQLDVFAHASLEVAVARAGAPGAVACLGNRDAVDYLGAVGRRQLAPTSVPVQPNTLYDLASLTKVVATTTAALLLVEDGALSLEQPVSEFIPESAFQEIRIRHLLAHTSGLPAHALLYKEVATMDEMVARIAGMPLASPPGTKRVYSDFGFMLLGVIVSLAGRDTFDAFCRRRIFSPLGMADTHFNPPPAWATRAAATEQCPWRGRILVGEVHDENAAAAGGVAGHAGLFSTAGDLAKFCRALLGGRLLKEATLDTMLQSAAPGYPWQGLGWKLDGWMDSNEGYLPSRSSFGHTGWTGTCLWLDRERARYAIVLSNTCHPTRENRNNEALRRTFFVPVTRRWYPTRTNAHPGLDRFRMEGHAGMGERLGLLTNAAALSSQGQPILEALQGAPLVRLFSPEHGLNVQAEAGEKVNSQRSALPVVSLYGAQQAPTREQLRDLDHFMVDLPDIGSRYYTYAATMKECLLACADAGVPVTVLDRPNPLGGAVLEGPVATRSDSLVCASAVPVRHGMTLGEHALFMHRSGLLGNAPAPTVVTAENWPRELLWWESGLPWRPPSPNIPDADTALLYVGMCLLEGVNLNEGRGTRMPFQVLGAPWLEPARVLDALDPRYFAGVSAWACEYTPVSLPGRAAKPVWKDKRCQGIQLHLRDRTAVRPFMMTVALLRTLLDTHGRELTFNTFFDTLAGGSWLQEQLRKSTPLVEIDAACNAQCQAFDAVRPKLYADSEALVAQFSGANPR